MTHSLEDLHVYLRSITPGERTSLSVLASLVAPGATVLDLGCGSGALGQHLSAIRGCTVDGVTLSEAEATHARPHYRRVVVDNLESCDLTGTFAGELYDFIVCADVLEHLSRPERVLAACRQLLKPEGRVLISVPNAGYIGLIAELLEGEFLYREEGLLDRTHLRFFTRRSLARFLGEQRWAIETIDTITRELPESEFDVAFDRLPPAVARHLLGAPDALTYQFICVAQPVAQVQHAEVPTALTASRAQARFSAELYLGQGGHYSEEHKLTASGVIGQERQTLRFELPDLPLAITQLRLDPADRPGFMHLYRLALRSAEGAELWQWSATAASHSLLAATPHSQIVWQAPLPAASGATLLLLAGDEPWFELPIPSDILTGSASGGGSLEVELGWPMSADYAALSATVLPLHDRIAQLESDAREMQAHLQTQLSQVQAALSTAQSRNILLEEGTQAASRQRATWQQEATRLQRDLAELAQHLHTIETSTVFRATRPIVHAKMRLDRLLGRAPRPSHTSTTVAPAPMTPPELPVDVIVPVYRGLNDTRLCIDSVLASTCQSAYRLIVINDASPEPEVTAWLRERAAQDARITLLENPENLGFVGTVNRGMALSESNDVLLLNSDTEVANNWLDRIRSAAYGDSKVASVTPFSNNATICSYPRFCKDNGLPAGYDTARLDALCAQTNPGAVVDVPTGVGFCMYIRRDCLAQVGLFDTENFGKGYGEENDFCQRAAAAGWRNLHLLDTFVLHTGGVSFGDSKSPRELAAMETLRRLHPRYERDVMAFVQTDPALPYRLALDVARITQSHLPVVLAVLHDRAGGTVRHVRELAQHLSDQAVFLTLTPAPDRCVRLESAVKDEGFQLVFRLADQYEDLVQALTQLGVRHVHYHHLLGHDPLILDLPPQLGGGYDFTAHDFYSYCTHISMTGSDNRYAGELAPGQCACCSPQDPAPMGGGTIADWRHRNRHFLTGARLVIAPSQDTARRIADFAPGARVRAIPHTDMAAPETAPPSTPSAKPLSAGAPLKIVVLGALSAIKGADLLEATALEAARRNAPVEFHLLGYGYRHLQTQPRAHLTVHGSYEDEDLPRLLQWLQPDLVWFPAQWPETYSYTLSASLQAGLPVVAPDLGAFPERLAGRSWSWVVRWDMSAAECMNLFTTLREQHFATGQPPQPPAQEVNTAASDWHYQRDYLAGLPLATTTTPLSIMFLQEHVPTPANVSGGAKSLLLTGVVRLRSHPLLRGVAQRIPQHWQTRVKNWLRA
jgi:GT2 family glycosyltransferase/2-polyprenyl-3-methyl-5-hydroxy-6-metoxy-1,4-benzoquinol methylase/glycosyltransferase involved in cell wall biosynthesis